MYGRAEGKYLCGLLRGAPWPTLLSAAQYSTSSIPRVRGQRIAPSGTKKAKEPPRFIVAEAVSAVRVARSEAVDPADLAWRTMPALAIDAFAGSSAQALREPCEGSVDMGLRGVGQGGAYVAAAAARVLVSTWAV